MAERKSFTLEHERAKFDISRGFYDASSLTWKNRRGRFGEVDDRSGTFAGFRGINLDFLPVGAGYRLEAGSDGTGTKVEVAERTRNHSTIPWDILAMTADDRSRWGVEPIFMLSNFDTRTLEDTPSTSQAMQELCRGLVDAAMEADIVVLNGETAILGDRVGGFSYHDSDLNYNWSGSMIGLVHESRIITGEAIKPGHSLIGLGERGFRSNGLTKVRRILGESLGSNWHAEPYDYSGVTLGEVVQAPSIIYCRFINKLTGGYDLQRPPLAAISGIAHISGSGMPEKLSRMLQPSGYGAVIDTPITPPEIMTRVQSIGRVSDREAYGTWHMGPGMIIATPEPEKVVAEAKAQGIVAKKIGGITDEPEIRIRNRGAVQEEEWLTFGLAAAA